MNILQMSHQELVEHIGEALVENPVLDAEESASDDENIALLQRLRWLEAKDRQNRYYTKFDMEDSFDPLMLASVPLMEESLQTHIETQLDAMHLPKSLYRAARFVAANLDENGYLPESPEVLAGILIVPAGLMEEAVALIRTMDPVGVGAIDLKDCLELQLSRMDKTELALKIVRNHLEKVSKNQFGAIAKAMCEPEAAVRNAVGLIRTLNPRPGAAFNSGESVNYIRPDVIIVKTGNAFEILTGDAELPNLHINSFYRGLLEESADKELTSYLEDKLRQAKWLINSISQRRSTLIRCSEAILDAQKDFFGGCASGLAPLTMAGLADRVGIHESTVSRAIKGKFLQCDCGIYPLRFFFTRNLGSADASTDGAKRMLRELIYSEDKEAPLSDQKIVEYMNERGIEISRRTVAKYRLELNIPNTCGRKSYT